MKRLFIDMDGTLAKFHDEVMYLERMYEEGFFRNLKPFENMVNGIKEFIRMHPDIEVYVVSAAIKSEYVQKEKDEWLDQYLPEIPAERRLYPTVGSSKAEFVKNATGISISKDDFLLDDYNKGLRDWELAGGTGIKCHNNINHNGLGLHGGEKGEKWIGEIVHIEDLPIMIASEISSHMELDFDFKPIFDAYYLTTSNISLYSTDINNKTVYAWEEKNASFDWEKIKKHSNPLDAIRYISTKNNYHEFEPIVIKSSGQVIKDEDNLRIVPKHKYDAINFNFNNKNVSAEEFWKGVFEKSKPTKFTDKTLATLPVVSKHKERPKDAKTKGNGYIKPKDNNQER